jgi:hypothetical protein
MTDQGTCTMVRYCSVGLVASCGCYTILLAELKTYWLKVLLENNGCGKHTSLAITRVLMFFLVA